MPGPAGFPSGEPRGRGSGGGRVLRRYRFHSQLSDVWGRINTFCQQISLWNSWEQTQAPVGKSVDRVLELLAAIRWIRIKSHWEHFNMCTWRMERISLLTLAINVVFSGYLLQELGWLRRASLLWKSSCRSQPAFVFRNLLKSASSTLTSLGGSQKATRSSKDARRTLS